ncbi:MAG: DNA polymerase I [Spirochaetales bacterium]|nr:DNA polymerase I [Spirochaetales bacterium]
MEKKPLYLLDGYSLIYRTYFAFMRKPLINSKGMNVSILYGFFNTLFSFFEKYKPECFAVVLDPVGPTFRHQMYEAYKANREKAPEDLHAQIPVVEEILAALKLPILRRDNFEADDIIATIAKMCDEQGRKCYILSSDKDLMQLVSDNVKMLKADSGDYIEIGYDGVVEKMGVRPDQIIDYLSLIGDTADNIPGVKGVGPKTAAGLLQKYETLDNIYNNLEAQTKSVQAKLADNRELAYLSRSLVVLATVEDLPEPETLELSGFDRGSAGDIFAEYEIKAFASRKGGSNSEGSGDGSSVAAVKESFKAGSVVTVLDEAGLEAMFKVLAEKRLFAFDIETDNIDEMVASPVGFSFAASKSNGYYLPLVASGAECLDAELVKMRLKEFFSNKELKVVGQNIKYDYKVLRRWGVEIFPYFDTMIAAWLIDAQFGAYGMDRLAADFLNYSTIKFSDLVGKDQLFSDVEIGLASDYAGEDAIVTFRLFRLFEQKLIESGLINILYTIEMPLLKILADAEMRGIIVDTKMLGFFEKKLLAQLDGYQKEIYQLCGKEFNINSTKQLQEVLFEDLKLPATKKTKTGYSTDISVLTELAFLHPAPKLILEHRMVSKLVSTYVKALPELVNPATLRLHTKFVQTGTATGRLSSRDPNLQNIPIKTEQGRLVRKAFVPKDGYVFVSADYSQIELVLLAHLSQDSDLMDAFKRGEDIHKETASFLFGTDIGLVTAEQRRVAKTINFGVIYGMSSFRLSRELGIPMSTANTFIESYFTRFGGLRKYIDETVAFAESNGYVETLLGHRRPILGINSRNKTEKSGAERVALNTVIQGSGADVIKIAMIKSDKMIREKSLDASLLLQIHDELLFEVEKDFAPEFAVKLKAVMESVVLLDLPLRVSVEIGNNWGELH